MGRLVGVCLALAFTLAAAGPSAKSLFQQGRKAERAGDVVRAYLFYAEAAAMDPARQEYWARAESLRTQAGMKARPHPVLTEADKRLADTLPAPSDKPESGISADDLAEVKRLRPPPELQPKAGRQTLELRGDYKAVFNQAAKAFGLDTIFDADYEPGRPLRLHLDAADYRECLRAVEAATGSFVVPLGPRLFLVAKDTQQKRQQVEPTVAIAVPIPDPVTAQEAQEMARAVQQALEIQKFAVDADRHMVLIRDRISKVRPAQILFEQLAHGRPQLEIQLEFYEANQSSVLSYGLMMPSSIPITWVGSAASGAAQLQSLARLFFGHTMLGVGIANANLFATMSKSNSKNLLQVDVRASDGQPATFHVGQRYPVMTGGFLGTTVSGVPPAFNFEDLGLTLKVTPHVHGMEEVSLEVNAEFKVLAGKSSNGIPVISNRSLDSKLRLKTGEWGVIAGLMSTSEARSITGIAGLMRLPLIGPMLSKNDRNQDSTEVLLLIKPRLLTLPASEYITREVWAGSETRFAVPL